MAEKPTPITPARVGDKVPAKTPTPVTAITWWWMGVFTVTLVIPLAIFTYRWALGLL